MLFADISEVRNTDVSPFLSGINAVGRIELSILTCFLYKTNLDKISDNDIGGNSLIPENINVSDFQ